MPASPPSFRPSRLFQLIVAIALCTPTPGRFARADQPEVPVGREALFPTSAETSPQNEDADKEKEDPGKRLELAMGLGYASYLAEAKPGHWYPVWVKIGSPGDAVEGEIFVSEPGNTMRTRIPFSVAKGATKLYRAYYRLKPSDPDFALSELIFEMHRDGNKEEMPQSLRLASPAAQHVLVLTENAGSFHVLNVRAPEDADPAQPPAFERLR